MIHKERVYKCIREINVDIKDGTTTFLEGNRYYAPNDNMLSVNNFGTVVDIPITPDVADKCFQEETVNHPSHYQGNIECIEVVRDMPFWKGNIIKYIYRAGIKEEFGKYNIDKEIEDLEKAKWYIQDRINQLKSK